MLLTTRIYSGNLRCISCHPTEVLLIFLLHNCLIGLKNKIKLNSQSKSGIQQQETGHTVLFLSALGGLPPLKYSIT